MKLELDQKWGEAPPAAFARSSPRRLPKMKAEPSTVTLPASCCPAATKYAG